MRETDEGPAAILKIRDFAKSCKGNPTRFMGQLPLPRNKPYANANLYSPAILLDDNETKVANEQFKELQKLFFMYHTKNPNSDKKGKTAIPMQSM